MPLYKRGNTWWIAFTTPVGERVRCSAGTADKTQAQEFHDKLKTDSWRVLHLGAKPKYTWDEAACKFLLETQHKTTHKRDKEKLRWLQQFLLNKPLHEVGRELIDHIAHSKAKETSPSTANRHLALIRAFYGRLVTIGNGLTRFQKLDFFQNRNVVYAGYHLSR